MKTDLFEQFREKVLMINEKIIIIIIDCKVHGLHKKRRKKISITKNQNHMKLNQSRNKKRRRREKSKAEMKETKGGKKKFEPRILSIVPLG